MSPLAAAIDQLVFARNYTLKLLNSIESTDWFRMPAQGITHIAWQVGHLAMAEYRLVLCRLRGPLPDDAKLITDSFILHFRNDPQPHTDIQSNPSITEIRDVFDRVHEQTLLELRAFPAEDLDSPPLLPHPLCSTKGECLRWCAIHEAVHAGQIGLLRRLLGQKPLW